jgi:hypothetical protein
MTAGVISPVVPQPNALRHSAAADRAKRVLPLPPTPVRDAAGTTVYGVATLDCNGRSADATMVTALGWGMDTRLDIPGQVRAGPHHG